MLSFRRLCNVVIWDSLCSVALCAASASRPSSWPLVTAPSTAAFAAECCSVLASSLAKAFWTSANPPAISFLDASLARAFASCCSLTCAANAS